MAPRPRKLYGYAPTPADGPLAAASLVMAMLRASGAHSVVELGELLDGGDEKATRWAQGTVISDDQRKLIKAHPEVVHLVRMKPTVTVAICPECGGATAVTGAAPNRCLLTFGCEGSPVKPTAARKVPRAAASRGGSS